MTHVEAQCQQLAEAETLQRELQLIIGRVEECAAQVHQNLDTLEWQRQREILRALVRRVEIGLDQVQVVFRVDALSGEADPGKKSLQLCKRSIDPALRGTFLCWHEGFLIYNSCLEPLPYGSGKEWTCSHFFQERRVIDFVEAAGDICVQHVS